MKRFVIYFGFVLVALLVASFPSAAQIINSAPTEIKSSDYDPIAATLDSLVNLNYIQRLNAGSSPQSGNYKPYEVPVYPDDIYRKRIQKIQTPIPLTFNSQVKEYINLYAVKKRALTERVMGLSKFYFPLYEQILDKQGLPLEFKYLSIVESALNPMAVSPVGATGLWQFMYATGRLYNLNINSFIDERKDPVKATNAACQYFKDMYNIYGDWLLVIAAYNCGAGNVNKAIARSGGKRTFWEISRYLPRETAGYVPAFIAVTYLMNYTAEHNLNAVPPVLTYFDADTVMVDQKISLRDVSDALNIPYDLLTYLNPVYKRGIIPDSEEPLALCLPSNKINSYLANISNIVKPQEDFIASAVSYEKEEEVSQVKKYHKVKRGEGISSIANRYSCSVSDIKRWNKLKSSRISAGQRLTVFVYEGGKKNDKLVTGGAVPKTAVSDIIAEKPSDSTQTNASVIASAKPLKKISDDKVVYHTVQPGDTLWKIAKRYDGVTVEQIKSINGLRNNDLKVGTKLKVQISS